LPDVHGAAPYAGAVDRPSRSRAVYSVALWDVDSTAPPLWTSQYRTHERLYAIVQASFQPGEALRQLGNVVRSRVNGVITLRLTRPQYDRLRKAKR
jgi:hypothetical protein